MSAAVRKCVACGEEISTRAAKCPACGTVQGPPRLCNVCGARMPVKALRCRDCKAYQDGDKCSSCSQLMPPGSRYCETCKSYRGWRWFFTGFTTLSAILAALVSVSTLFVAQYTAYLHRNSETSIAFTRADAKNMIYVVISNAGLSRSTFRGAKLKFGAIDIEDRDVVLFSTDGSGEVRRIIPAGGEMRAGLLVEGLRTRLRQGKTVRFTRDEVFRQLNGHVVMLEVEIQESNGRQIRKEAIAGSQLKLLVDYTLPRDTP
jgi:hypothetical protein